jgi:[histone H3]-lysine36 N-dimethyltransferase SETMAR
MPSCGAARWTGHQASPGPAPNLDGFPSVQCGCACSAEECGGPECACVDANADAVGLGSEVAMGSRRECGNGCAC